MTSSIVLNLNPITDGEKTLEISLFYLHFKARESFQKVIVVYFEVKWYLSRINP